MRSSSVANFFGRCLYRNVEETDASQTRPGKACRATSTDGNAFRATRISTELVHAGHVGFYLPVR